MNRSYAANVYKGDLAYIFKEKTLLNYPFPLFKDEKFAPELLVWNDMADKEHVAYSQKKVLSLCEYFPERYAARLTSNLKANPTSFKFFYKPQFYRVSSPIGKLKYCVRLLQYLYFSFMKSVLK